MRSSCLTLLLHPCVVTIAVSLTSATEISTSLYKYDVRGHAHDKSCHKPYSNYCKVAHTARKSPWM